MIRDFQRRFWVCLALPIMALSPMIQAFLGVGDAWRFAGDTYWLLAFSTVVDGAGLLLSPAVGAVLMSVSTLIVALNARLLRLERL